MYVIDLKGYLGPKCKGSKAVQHDLVECYLLPICYIAAPVRLILVAV